MGLLQIPFTKGCNHIGPRKCTYFVLITAFWNDLCLEICVATILTSFRKLLKTRLFSQALGDKVIMSPLLSFCFVLNILIYWLVVYFICFLSATLAWSVVRDHESCNRRVILYKVFQTVIYNLGTTRKSSLLISWKYEGNLFQRNLCQNPVLTEG